MRGLISTFHPGTTHWDGAEVLRNPTHIKKHLRTFWSNVGISHLGGVAVAFHRSWIFPSRPAFLKWCKSKPTQSGANVHQRNYAISPCKSSSQAQRISIWDVFLWLNIRGAIIHLKRSHQDLSAFSSRNKEWRSNVMSPTRSMDTFHPWAHSYRRNRLIWWERTVIKWNSDDGSSQC